MAVNRHDAIVVGARCAGSPTAMLLARRGHKVLLVDRATFPSDTVSTHLIHPPGVSALQRWGLLDRLIATDCPSIHEYAFDMGPFVIRGAPGKPDSPVSYAPRRTVLDKLLVDAAAEAGVEVRESFTVESLEFENGRVTGIRGHAKGGETVTERAQVVIGADGVNSFVARNVNAESYNEKSQIEAGYYTYWSDLPTDGRFEAFDRHGRGWAAWPTHGGLTLVVVSWPYAEFETNRHDIERHYLESLDRAPAFAERVRAAKREERYVGTAVPNYFRKPYGPGWALVGDAGYMRDFITAQGISDSFLSAEACAEALHDVFTGTRSFDDALAAYQQARDARVLPMYEFTCRFAMLEPPSEQMVQLLSAVHGNQRAMDGFAQVISGVTSPAEFFSPASIQRIFAEQASQPSA